MTIYFIQEQSERGLIKIGYTKHPNAKLRLAHLKMTSPCELIIIQEALAALRPFAEDRQAQAEVEEYRIEE